MVKKLKDLKVIFSLPPEFLLSKAKQSMLRKYLPNDSQMKVRPVIEKWEQFKSTYPVFSFNHADLRMVIEESNYEDIIKNKADEVADHRFDLLGSGLTEVDYEFEAKGILGHCYQMMPGDDEKNAIKQAIANSLKIPAEEFAYQPIDWHRDFKSGYRWNPKTSTNKQPLSPLPGADVKVPWELSRFQHAPLLGLAGLIDQENDRWVNEFMFQVTDWIAANPYPCGKNWSCTMDVAIRAVNWLWGWLLFRDNPAIAAGFAKLLTESLYQHGQHIEGNLEFVRRGYHGNHYLSNIVGLIYIGSFMPCFPESDRWLAFGIQELVEEMKHQVYSDGVSFEGSTSYHRLAAELFYSATAVVLNLDEKRKEDLKKYEAGEHRVKPALKPSRQQEFDLESEAVFPRWYYTRLLNMAEVIFGLTGPDGKVPQFGDSDSGRLHKFSPVVTEEGEECFNDHHHILALAGQLFGRADLTEAGEAYRLDAELLMGQVPFLPLRNGKRKRQVSAGLAQLTSAGSSTDDNIEERTLAGKVTGKTAKGLVAELTITFRAGAGSGAGARVETGAGEPAMPRVYYYPDGGLALYKNELYYFAFACIPCGLGGVGAHNHNDLLSFVLNVGTQDFFVDGGSYLYSADAALRNAFRSTRAHNTVAVRGRGQRKMLEDYLFILPQKGKAAISELSAGRVRGFHDGFGFRHSREVSFAAESITVRDHLAKRCQAEQILNLAPGVQIEAGEKGRVYLNNGNVQLELSGTGVKDMVVEEGFYSPSYGKRVANKRLVFPL